jgi:hypothetical protein
MLFHVSCLFIVIVLAVPVKNASMKTTFSPTGTRKVLRAEISHESTSGFVISAVDVIDACCGPNEAMQLESEHLYATLAQQLSKAASVDLSILFAPKPALLGEVTLNAFDDTGRSPRRRPARLNDSLISTDRNNLTVTSSQSSSLARLRVVSPSHQWTTTTTPTHPTSHSGRELVALGSESYRQRQTLKRFIEETKQLAAEAKQTLAAEYQHQLQEQTQNWQRYVAQLNDEMQKMNNTIRDQQLQLSKVALLTVPRAIDSSINSQIGRSCGGPMPPSDRFTAVSLGKRKLTYGCHRSHEGAAPQDDESARASDELLPQRVTEALLHMLQKQPAPPRKSASRTSRTSPKH